MNYQKKYKKESKEGLVPVEGGEQTPEKTQEQLDAEKAEAEQAELAKVEAELAELEKAEAEKKAALEQAEKELAESHNGLPLSSAE